MSTQAPAPIASLTMQLMNPLLNSLNDVYGVTLSSKIAKDKLEIRPADAALGDITTWVGIMGCVQGIVAISYTKQTAIAAAEKMLGEASTEIDEDVVDALSEIANMVVGGAKSKLEIGLAISLPSVVEGNQRINFPKGSQPMRLSCNSDIGPFTIDFGFIFETW